MRDGKAKVETATRHSLQAQRIPFDSIPIIDLEPWFAGDARAKLKVAQTVHTTCRDIGFMYFSNHGISQELVDETFQQALRFFSLPDGEKQQVHYEKSGRHRGYIPIGAESTDPVAVADLKEAFDYGLELSSDDVQGPAAERMRAPNLFPTGVPGFREAVERYFVAVTDLAKTLFRIFAVGFGLPAQFFAGQIDQPIAQMRLLLLPAASCAGQYRLLGYRGAFGLRMFHYSGAGRDERSSGAKSGGRVDRGADSRGHFRGQHR